MTDEAEFTVRLIDKVKGPARSAKKSIEGLIAANKKLSKAEKALGRTRDRNGRLRDLATGRYARGAGGGGGGGGSGIMSIVGGNLITSAIMKVGELVKGIAAAGAGMVTFGQNTALALGNLTKHGVDPAKLFDHATALAVRFGLDLQDTTEQYKKFLALQFTPKGADKLIRMGADLRSLGASAEDVSGVFTALGQIKGKGKLQGDEMLQLAERGVSTALVTEEIGKLMGGKSADEVQKLQSQGEVKADIALQAIENAINRKLQQSSLGESGAKFADSTIEGMLGRFKALSEGAGLKAVKLIAAPVTKLMSTALGSFESFLRSDEGAATIEKIAVGLGKAAEWAGALAVAFKDSFGSTFETQIKPLFKAFDLFGDGASIALSLGTALGEVAALGVGAAGALVLAGSAVAALIGPVYTIGKAIVTGLVDPLAAMSAEAILWFADLGRVLGLEGLSLGEKAWEVGKRIMQGLGDGVLALLRYPIDAIKSAGTNVIGALKDVLDIHSPSRVTKAIGANLGKGLALGIESTRPLLLATGERMGGTPVAGLEDRMYGPEMRSARLAPPAAASASSGAAMHMSITQHIQGGGNAEETARIVARETRREIEATFRQWAMELG